MEAIAGRRWPSADSTVIHSCALPRARRSAPQIVSASSYLTIPEQASSTRRSALRVLRVSALDEVHGQVVPVAVLGDLRVHDEVLHVDVTKTPNRVRYPAQESGDITLTLSLRIRLREVGMSTPEEPLRSSLQLGPS